MINFKWNLKELNFFMCGKCSINYWVQILLNVPKFYYNVIFIKKNYLVLLTIPRTQNE